MPRVNILDNNKEAEQPESISSKDEFIKYEKINRLTL